VPDSPLFSTARAALDAALAAADPEPAVRGWLREHPDSVRPNGRLVVMAVGKAAAAMARGALAERAAHACWVVTKDGHAQAALADCTVRETGHPLPDGRSLAAGAELRALAEGLGEGDELLLLVSGGASALAEDLPAGVEAADWCAANHALLASGRPIADLNTVRKHLSRLKGGGLARLASPARVTALQVSDVIGDDSAVIGSGPAAGDPSTFAEAAAVAGAVDGMPESVRAHLAAGARGEHAETPKPDDLAQARNAVVASNRVALEAAATHLAGEGYPPLILTSRLQGEAREVARAVAAVAQEAAAAGDPAPPPCALLWGGETTVSLGPLPGEGGRNQELAVALAPELAGWTGIGALCAGTDGTDGPGEAAGGWVDHTTRDRAHKMDYPVAEALADNDSGGLLAALGDRLVTGPTGTNVMDLTLVLIDRPTP
jgi:glycerate-2-kinase